MNEHANETRDPNENNSSHSQQRLRSKYNVFLIVNKKVSYHKQIARQHSCHRKVWQGGKVVDPAKKFFTSTDNF